METDVKWETWDQDGLEHCTLSKTIDGVVLMGAIVGPSGGTFCSIREDASFRTLDVRVHYTSGSSLELAADGQGGWVDAVTGTRLNQLNGCLDVNIGLTPATNMLPIKRLGLARNERREIKVVYVPPPEQVKGEFRPNPASQQYTCLEPDKRYRYKGLLGNFTAVLEVDEDGLPLDYPDTFRRLRLVEAVSHAI